MVAVADLELDSIVALAVFAEVELEVEIESVVAIDAAADVVVVVAAVDAYWH